MSPKIYKKRDCYHFRRIGRQPEAIKLNDEHRDHLKAKLEKNCTMTVEAMVRDLLNNFDNLSVSKSTIRCFVVNDLNFTFKRVREAPYVRNTDEMIEARYDYACLVNQTDLDYSSNCVFIDEPVFQLDIQPLNGWSEKGSTLVNRNKQDKTENKSVLGAICCQGVVQLNLKRPTANVSKRAKGDSKSLMPTI